jgi:indole-3-glycerol phosphate synthase
MQIIAEVKTFSPFGWRSQRSWEELFAIAHTFGDIISIHTDPRWHGSFELVKRARKLTSKPILAKGIHARDIDIKRALDAGANFVLVVGRVPAVHKEKCLIEPNSLAELSALPEGVKAVWNSRDLTTGGLKPETFHEARKLFKGWLCQASNIGGVNDIDPKADAILVGTHLDALAKKKDFIKSL